MPASMRRVHAGLTMSRGDAHEERSNMQHEVMIRCGGKGDPAGILLANDALRCNRGDTRCAPQANGLVEKANRYLMKGIKTRLGRERKGWVDELPNVVWPHGTSLKTSNGETSCSLTFGSEAVIPGEIGMSTHRTMMIKEGKGNEEEMRLNLDLLQERREATTIREARNKMKMKNYYNKRARLMSFKVGDYVYRRNETSHVENLGKLGPKWEGLYLVTEAY
ncbi:reverse transcriptase domain-containing protein [Tanacetum coccineum]